MPPVESFRAMSERGDVITVVAYGDESGNRLLLGSLERYRALLTFGVLTPRPQ